MLILLILQYFPENFVQAITSSIDMRNDILSETRPFFDKNADVSNCLRGSYLL